MRPLHPQTHQKPRPQVSSSCCPPLTGEAHLLTDAESTLDAPLPPQNPPLRDAELLGRFKTMLQAKLLTATTKLAAQLTKEIHELGIRTNDLEDKMDTAITVIENYEQDLSDLKKELASALLQL